MCKHRLRKGRGGSCPGEQLSGGKVFIGVDVGSASVRAGVYADTGRRHAFAVRPIRQFQSANTGCSPQTV